VHVLPPTIVCPGLQDLIIRHEVLIVPHRCVPPYHPTVKRITIEDMNYTSRQEISARPLMHASLTDLCPEYFPALECIRMLLPVLCKDQTTLQFSESEVAWIKLCISKGIVFLVSRGADEWTADEWTVVQPESMEPYGP
jgi:hypothetical protein